jgi:hypothetical protein
MMVYIFNTSDCNHGWFGNYLQFPEKNLSPPWYIYISMSCTNIRFVSWIMSCKSKVIITILRNTNPGFLGYVENGRLVTQTRYPRGCFLYLLSLACPNYTCTSTPFYWLPCPMLTLFPTGLAKVLTWPTTSCISICFIALMTEAAGTSEASVNFYQTHCATTQKIAIFILSIMRWNPTTTE